MHMAEGEAHNSELSGKNMLDFPPGSGSLEGKRRGEEEEEEEELRRNGCANR